MKQLQKVTAIIFFLLLLFNSCTYDNEVDYFKDSTNTCDIENMSFQTDVYPVISNSCVGCHNNSFASGRINLEGYDNVKKNSEMILKTIKHQAGVEPMPQGAAKLPDCTIEKINAWVDQGMKNN